MIKNLVLFLYCTFLSFACRVKYSDNIAILISLSLDLHRNAINIEKSQTSSSRTGLIKSFLSEQIFSQPWVYKLSKRLLIIDRK